MENIIDALIRKDMIITSGPAKMQNKAHAIKIIKYLVRLNAKDEKMHQLLLLTLEKDEKGNMEITPSQKLIDLKNWKTKTRFYNTLVQRVNEVYEKNGQMYCCLLYFAKDTEDKITCWKGRKFKNTDLPALMRLTRIMLNLNTKNFIKTTNEKQKAIPIALAYHYKMVTPDCDISVPTLCFTYALIPDGDTGNEQSIKESMV